MAEVFIESKGYGRPIANEPCNLEIWETKQDVQSIAPKESGVLYLTAGGSSSWLLFVGRGAGMTVLAKMGARQVTNIIVEGGGLLHKTYLVITGGAESESGVESGSASTWWIDGLENPGRWKMMVESQEREAESLASGEGVAVSILVSRERTSFDEIRQAVLSQVPVGKAVAMTDSDVVKFLEREIRDKRIDGFIDENQKQFIHMAAYKQTTKIVQYNVVSQFDFSEGLLKIKCPSCGSSNIQREKASEAKCAHCGTTYIVPTKVLDLI